MQHQGTAVLCCMVTLSNPPAADDSAHRVHLLPYVLTSVNILSQPSSEESVTVGECHGGLLLSVSRDTRDFVTTVTQRYTQNITTSHCHTSFATSYIYILCLK